MDELRSPVGVTRRSLLQGTGALIVSFALAGRTLGEEEAPPAPVVPVELPGDLASTPMLDSWILIDADSTVTVFTGKVEYGQGVKTAILQRAAEELDIDPRDIVLVTADTMRSPNEGYTAGSMSMSQSAVALRNAAAQVRELLLGQAAKMLGVPVTSLHVENGQIVGGPKALRYGEAVAEGLLHVQAQPTSKLKPAGEFRFIGQPMQRVDIPAKVTGGASFVHDLRLPGMLHARVVRPPSYAAVLNWCDAKKIETLPGVVKVVWEGNFLAVIATEQWLAIKAMRALAATAIWNEVRDLPDILHLPRELQALPVEDGIVADSQTKPVGVAKDYEAWFTRPYLMHGAIGPSCAVGVLDADGLTTIYTHSQGVYPDRDAIAQMLAVGKAKVHLIHMEGAGCYGHNAADDAAADAALLARAVPGKPVRVQHMREQEHTWEPYGPAMVTHIRAGIDADGKIAAWDYELWSNTHGTRPGSAGALAPARHITQAFAPDEAKLAITPNGNGDRNAEPGYTLPQKRVIWHFMKDMPIRVSALRGLGAYANVFSIESTMDELALLAGADPVAFRLRHLDDPRGREVIATAARNFGWSDWQKQPDHGRGFAYARYKNHASYLAIALEIVIDRPTGEIRVKRANAAIDSGEIVNPDGLRNQTEGGILQSMSWTLHEAVMFDRIRIQSYDWLTYPILRFRGIPDAVDVAVIPRPGEPFLGAGEAAQGPTAAALANALRDATGARLTNLPLSPGKVMKAVLGQDA